MKRILTLIMCLLFGLLVNAQTSGGPDAYGYTWKTSAHTVSPPVYAWKDISTIGVEVNGLSDDNIVGPFSASNGFQFYWYPTPQFWIGSNGYISFSGTQMASPFPASIPLSSGGNNWIAPLMSDLNFDGATNPGKVYYWYNADSLVVSFITVPLWINASPAYTGSNTFQIVLNKVDKSITYNFQSMSMGAATSFDMAMGIENNTGTLGLGVLFDAMPSNLSAVKFYYPGTVTYAVTDLGVNWNGDEKNRGIFVKSGVATPLVTNVKNFGNQVLGSFTVRDTVNNLVNFPLTQGSMSLPGLAIGEDTTVTLPNTFTPPSAGIYKLNTSVTGISGDMVADNNRKVQEIIAIDTTSSFMTFDYSDGIYDGTGLGWVGGNGGIGIHIVPPTYPLRIVSSRFMITANTGAVGFYAMIYDDNGINGGPGALLDSVYVPFTSISTGAYTVVPTANSNVVITSGGIYLRWHMGGADINLGRDLTPPFSHRTFEVLGNVWADYRDKFSEDFLLGITCEYAGPKADFTVDDSQDPTISFTDNSYNNPAAWSWDFGDNTTDTVQNPTHTYSNIGTFNVCLTVSNSLGNHTLCKNVNITNGPPVANFTYILSGMPTISFIDLSVGNPTSWHWDFDDGGGSDTSNLQNPYYSFTANGPHNVCLTTSNAYGMSQAFCQSLTVTGVGINELDKANDINISPNPFVDNARIDLGNSNVKGTLNLKCFTILGQAISIDYHVEGDAIVLNRGKLQPGTYMLEIRDETRLLATRKVMVQ